MHSDFCLFLCFFLCVLFLFCFSGTKQDMFVKYRCPWKSIHANKGPFISCTRVQCSIFVGGSARAVIFVFRSAQKTRGPKGHCRSPEYNECIKNLTSQWNQKLEAQGPFIAHMRTNSKHFSQIKDNQNDRTQINACVVGNTSVCCCEHLVWRRISSKEKPFLYLFLPHPGSTPWNILPKPLPEWQHSK